VDVSLLRAGEEVERGELVDQPGGRAVGQQGDHRRHLATLVGAYRDLSDIGVRRIHLRLQRCHLRVEIVSLGLRSLQLFPDPVVLLDDLLEGDVGLVDLPLDVADGWVRVRRRRRRDDGYCDRAENDGAQQPWYSRHEAPFFLTAYRVS